MAVKDSTKSEKTDGQNLIYNSALKKKRKKKKKKKKDI